MTPQESSYIDLPLELLENGLLVGQRKLFSKNRDYLLLSLNSKNYKVPTNIPFGTVLIRNLKDIFGNEWGDNEQKKSIADQNVIVKWVSQLTDFANYIEKNTNSKGVLTTQLIPGNYISLITFAHDLFSILSNGNKIPRELIDKVKGQQGPDKILGAMYELRIAGIFSRAGYSLKWSADKKKTIPEFVATHKYFGDNIAVEAKTISRPGVFNRNGKKEDNEKIRTLISSHLQDAINKKVKQNASEDLKDMPYFIFIDMNWPNLEEPENIMNRWAAGIQTDILEKLSYFETPSSSPFNGIYLTNYAWHYYDMMPISINQPFVLIGSSNPQNNTTYKKHISLIQLAISQYVSIVNIAPQKIIDIKL